MTWWEGSKKVSLESGLRSCVHDIVGVLGKMRSGRSRIKTRASQGSATKGASQPKSLFLKSQNERTRVSVCQQRAESIMTRRCRNGVLVRLTEVAYKSNVGKAMKLKQEALDME